MPKLNLPDACPVGLPAPVEQLIVTLGWIHSRYSDMLDSSAPSDAVGSRMRDLRSVYGVHCEQLLRTG